MGEQHGYICLYILLCVKQVTSGRLLYNTGSARCSVMTKLDKMWMDGRLKGGYIYIYIYTYIQQIHFIVQQKLTKHCSAIILQ